jgi:acyl-CoA thioesterase-2
MTASAALAELLDLLLPSPVTEGRDDPAGLALGPVAPSLFRAQSQDLGWGRVFGGQVLAQGLAAAASTLSDPESRPAHALHAAFLEPGDPAHPIDYAVTPLRDGLSFSTRLVLAHQRLPGRPPRPVLSLTASFQAPEDGFEHASSPPDVPDPETLPSESTLAAAWVHRLPAPLRARFTEPRPVDIRPVTPNDPLTPELRPPVRAFWYRAAAPLPDAVTAHQRLFAWASDFNLLGTAMQPHGVTWLMRDMQVASLDHALWFHRPFRFDDWLLFSMESPTASGARGLAQARVFDRAGRHVATVAQEGLMRRRPQR